MFFSLVYSYYIYIQGNTAHNRKWADECVKCFFFFKAFATSRSRSWKKTESHTKTVKFLSEELSIDVSSSQQGHLRIIIIIIIIIVIIIVIIIHRGVWMSTCWTISYHVGNDLELFIQLCFWLYSTGCVSRQLGEMQDFILKNNM